MCFRIRWKKRSKVERRRSRSPHHPVTLPHAQSETIEANPPNGTSSEANQPLQMHPNLALSGPKARSSFTSTALNAARLVLDLVAQSSDAFPPLKGTANGLIMLITRFEQTASNQTAIHKISLRIQNLNESLTSSVDEAENRRRKRLESKINDVLRELGRLTNENIAQTFFNNVENSGTISGLVDDIRDAILDYQTSIQQAIYSMNAQQMTSDELHFLDTLPRARDAAYDSGNRQPCLKGTRTELLQEIDDWSLSEGEPVYWLNGAPGTGKTTISQTLAETWFAEGRLGGSFFFSRDSVDRSNMQLVFPTIAFQLAYRFPELRFKLAEMIKSHPDVGHLSLVNQLHYLLITPFNSLTSPITFPVIIMIDALDECTDSEPESKILSILSEKIDQIPFLRFFITSRPEYQIRSVFNKPLKYYTKELILHDIDRAMVDRDIAKFLGVRLLEVASRSDTSIAPPWPSQDEIDAMVKKCSGLFIYASTTVNFIASILDNPVDRMQLVIGLPNSSANEGALRIDPLYNQVLRQAEVQLQSNGEGYVEQAKTALALVLLTFNPVSCEVVASLLNWLPGKVRRVLRFANSVLLISDDQKQAIRSLHKSFYDFVTDAQRCKIPHFYVDLKIHHGKIGIACLQLMLKALKKNIGSMPRYAMNADVQDLPARRKEKIGDALEYACRCWPQHITLAGKTGEHVLTFLESLNELMETRALMWLEVLSICGGLHDALHGLQNLREWLGQCETSSKDHLESVYDLERFILQFSSFIEKSAPHIYHSALPFTPKRSYIRMRYQRDLENEVKVAGNCLDPWWDECFGTVQLERLAKGLTFSHDSQRLACVLDETIPHSVLILDSLTGARLAVFAESNPCLHIPTNETLQYDVAVQFSPDDRTLVFLHRYAKGLERVMQLWDVNTGGMVADRSLQGSNPSRVSFSPNGRSLAVGEGHCIVFYDVPSGKSNGIRLEGHDSDVSEVSWSPAGNRVLSATRIGSIKLWDILTKTCLRDVNLIPLPERLLTSLDGPPVTVEQLAHSPDGLSFAFVYYASQIHICNAETLDTIHILSRDNPDFPLLLFSDGPKSLTFGSPEKVWFTLGTHTCCFDLSSGRLETTNVTSSAYHDDGGRKFAASGDGTFVASFSVKVGKLMKTRTRSSPSRDIETHPMDAKPLLGTSEDGELMLFEGEGQATEVWIAASGSRLTTVQCEGSIQKLITNADRSLVAFSYNGKQSSGIFVHSVIVVHSVETGEQIHKLELREAGGDFSRSRTMMFSPESRYLMAVCHSGAFFKVWDVTTGAMLSTVDTDRFSTGFAFTPGDQFIRWKEGEMIKRVQINPNSQKAPSSQAELVNWSDTLPLEEQAPPYKLFQQDPQRPQFDTNVLDVENRLVLFFPPQLRARPTNARLTRNGVSWTLAGNRTQKFVALIVAFPEMDESKGDEW